MRQCARPRGSADASPPGFGRPRQASGERVPGGGAPCRPSVLWGWNRAGRSSQALDGGGRPPAGGAGRMPRTARAWASAAGFPPVVPTGERSGCEPTPTNGRAAGRENNGMHLVDWIGQVPRSGEKPPSGERFPPSFRPSSIKVGAGTAAIPAPQRDRCPSGEWFDRSRLEQRWEPGSNLLWAGASVSCVSAPRSRAGGPCPAGWQTSRPGRGRAPRRCLPAGVPWRGPSPARFRKAPKPRRHHSRPEGQDRGAVDADGCGPVGHGWYQI